MLQKYFIFFNKGVYCVSFHINLTIFASEPDESTLIPPMLWPKTILSSIQDQVSTPSNRQRCRIQLRPVSSIGFSFCNVKRFFSHHNDILRMFGFLPEIE